MSIDRAACRMILAVAVLPLVLPTGVLAKEPPAVMKTATGAAKTGAMAAKTSTEKMSAAKTSAVPKKPAAPKKRAEAKEGARATTAVGGGLDCARLARRMRRCAVAVAQSLSPSLSGVLGRLPTELRGVVRRAIARRFGRVLDTLCRAQRGWARRSTPLRSCWHPAGGGGERGARCAAFASCLAKQMPASSAPKKP